MSDGFSLSKWFEAAKAGNIRYIVQHKSIAMKGGAVPQDQMYPNNTALMYAAANNKKQCASILLVTERSRQNKAGWSAMHWASYNNNVELVKLLKNFEAGLASTETYNGVPAQSTALQIAMQRGNHDVFNILVTEEQKQSKLLQAHITAFSSTSFSPEIVEQMKRRVDADSIGRTPLHYLALNNQPEVNEQEYRNIFAALVEMYCRETDVLGNTATMLAAQRGNKLFVTLMADRENDRSGSAELKMLNSQGHSALMIASEQPQSPENHSIVQSLQPYEAKMQSPLGESALMCASRSNNVGAVEVLKKSELKLQTTSQLNGLPAGSTALMVAVQHQNDECAEQLQDEKLSVSQRDKASDQYSQSQDHEKESIVHTQNPFAHTEKPYLTQTNESLNGPQLLTTGELKRSELQTMGVRCQECEYYKNEAEKRVFEVNSLKQHISDLQQQLKLNNSQISQLQGELESKSTSYLALMQQLIRQGVKVDTVPNTVTIDYIEQSGVPVQLKNIFQQVSDGIKQAKQGGDVIQELTDIIMQLQKDVVELFTTKESEQAQLAKQLEAQQQKCKEMQSNAEAKTHQLEEKISSLENENLTQNASHAQTVEKLNQQLEEYKADIAEIVQQKEQQDLEKQACDKQLGELTRQNTDLHAQIRQLQSELETTRRKVEEKDEKIKTGRTQNFKLAESVQTILDQLRVQQKTLSTYQTNTVVQSADDK